MSEYSFSELQLHTRYMIERFGRSLVMRILNKAITLYQESIPLVSKSRINDINARVSERYYFTNEIYVCLECKNSLNGLVYIEGLCVTDVGKIGLALPYYFQSSYGSFKHSLDHIIKSLSLSIVV